jgi:peptidyl-prolyl cis-trans isomerase B (cyclophilin B)
LKKIVVFVAAILLCWSQSAWADGPNPRVRLETSLGAIVLELDAQKAPKTVENFLTYVREGFYDGSTFHRVIKGFMIQGGGLTADMGKKPTHPPVQNEADNGLKNKRGSIAMARTNEPHSATSQFFINTKDNVSLDYRESPPTWGYCVFGKVVEGMNVVDAIEGVPTGAKAGRRDVPVKTVIIEKATVLN